MPSAFAMPDVVRVTTIDLTGIGEALDRARQTFTGDRRRGIGEMLTVLVAVLKVTDPHMRRGHREMMAALLTALVDLDRGKEPELLAKNKVEHRPQQSLDVWRVRANAAHVADLLERWGIERSPATLAKYVVLGGGPKFHKAGRWPLYDPDELDRWAAELIGRPLASTSASRED